MSVLDVFHTGFHDLVSVVPPGAQVAPWSRLSARDAGKVPGHRNAQGLWVGYPWMHYRPRESDIQQWLADGANIGFGGWAFPALDVDVTDPVVVRDIVAAVEALTGPTLQRTGRAPKTLLVFRCAEPLKAFDMRYARENHTLLGEERQLVQFLGIGRQYVMFGTHPGTGQPYHLQDPLDTLTRGPDTLPLLDPERLIQVFDAITEVMARHGYTASGEASARLQVGEVVQDTLKAPSILQLDLLVADIPNITPHRDEYIEMGYAIKGAGQDDPEAALAVFQSWCDRWEHYNDPEQVARDWGKMVPPYRTGYETLLRKGRELGVNTAGYTFGPAAPAPEPAPDVTPDPHPETTVTPPASSSSPPPTLTDIQLAQTFVQHHRHQFAVVPDFSHREYQWDGRRWHEVPQHTIEHAVRDFLLETSRRATMAIESDTARTKLLERLQAYRMLTAVTQQVLKHEHMAHSIKTLDQHDHPHYLNTPAGVFDLTTGEAVTPDPARLMLNSTAVAPTSGDCPHWKAFLRQVTCDDDDLVRYLQRLAGYSLTGYEREHKIIYFRGGGGNGKSVFVETLATIWGDYSKSIPIENLMQRRDGSQNAQLYLSELVGARMIHTAEPESGSHWNDREIKRLSGGNTLTGRRLYGQPFTFQLKGSLIVEGNEIPALQSVGRSIRRRLHIVPWDFQVMREDQRLKDRFKEEYGAILAWAMEGARQWFQDGLGNPRPVVEASDTYLTSQDVIAQWATDTVQVGDRADHPLVERITNRELYQHYTRWSHAQGKRPLPETRFIQNAGDILEGMGAVRFRGNAGRGWENLRLLPIQNELPPRVVPFTPPA